VKGRPYVLLLAVTWGALLVHGYHPYAEDAEIYVPGIVKLLHPTYYPFGQEFFETHAHLTLYPDLIAWSARLTHLPLDWTLFLWHVATIFLLLLACWRIAEKCFSTPQGRWGAVGLVAALLTLPVAGTALYILDQYLNPRSFSAFAVLFATDAAMEKNYWVMGLWLVFTAAIHPLMTVFGIALIFLLLVSEKITQPGMASMVMLFPTLFPKNVSATYWECLHEHRYYFLLRWEWYEWLGIVAPLALLWWFSRIARKRKQVAMEKLAFAMFLFGTIFFAAGLIVTIPKCFEILTPYQPMRSLLLVYIFLALFGGGLLGEFFLKNHALRWLALFVPLCAGMMYAQFQLFPGGRHVEWPGAAPTNPWMQAFAWIRGNTPTNAIFALDPHFMELPGENYQGFRAAAERSRLADAVKDWSAAVMYPGLPFADHVHAQVQALEGWKKFGATDFKQLEKNYGVTWVVLQQQQNSLPDCPYDNGVVKVCRVNEIPR
jgi:hypothetical protein